MGSQSAGNSLGDTEADNLDVHVGNVCGKIIFDQSVKSLGSFFFEDRIGSRWDRRRGKFVASDRTQRFGYGVGVSDRP